MGRTLRTQALLEPHGGLHRPLRMILTRDRYAKECHEAVVKEGLYTAATVLGRNEMDPPLCGSTAMSHNEFKIRELM